MSEPITINIDAGWLSRVWACVPKTRADFYALPGKILGKVWTSIQWAADHTQVWLALAAAFVAGAALSPLTRPHLSAYSVPMIEAENVAPRTVNVDLSGVNRVLNELASRTANLERMAAATQSTALTTQGTVAGIKDFTDHVPEMLAGASIFGAAKAVEAPPRHKSAPAVKKVQTAPVAPAAVPAPSPAQPQPLSLPDWIKSKL